MYALDTHVRDRYGIGTHSTPYAHRTNTVEVFCYLGEWSTESIYRHHDFIDSVKNVIRSSHYFIKIMLVPLVYGGFRHRRNIIKDHQSRANFRRYKNSLKGLVKKIEER